MAAIYLLLYRTRFGRGVRATMQDPTAARLVGINVNRVAALTFGIGVAVTAAGGMVFGATSGGFNPNSGYDLISRLLAIVILGGLGSIGGALVAAVFMITAGIRGRHLVAELGRRWCSTRRWCSCCGPPGRAVRPAGGEGAVTAPRAPGRTRPPAPAVVGRRRWPWQRRWPCRGGAAGVAVFPLVFTNPTVTTIAVRHADLRRGRLGLEHLLRLLRLHLPRPRGVLRHRRLHGGHRRPGLAVTGGRGVRLLPLAGVVAAVIAVPLGLVALRVRRHTFVVITIAFFFIFQLMAFNLSRSPAGRAGIARAAR